MRFFFQNPFHQNVLGEISNHIINQEDRFVLYANSINRDNIYQTKMHPETL
jgi:hypothetical protein